MCASGMRVFTLVLLAVALAPMALAKPHRVLTRVTVEQFDALIATLAHKSDRETAHAIAAVELAERPSPTATAR